MADHPLDRPDWHALQSRQAQFSVGGSLAKRYVADVSIFAAARDDRPESHAAFRELIPADGTVIHLRTGEGPLPAGTHAEKTAPAVQMVATEMRAGGGTAPIEPLGEADAAEMLALATLTRPGPFFENTHRLGSFWGIRQHGRLVAMAGERMKLDGFTELSGVCTHPDFRGRGYAAALSRVVCDAILRRGETPFLHAYAANTVAIDLYRSLGFAVRAPFVVTVLSRARNDRDAEGRR
ncbi:GNAT family N-acetyltransferase [Ensifer adhaerens]|uniref:GNAT family N-acetyltransferase n=1 Tax=Ensifer adhaerens TaxID=106592 RepID=UPI003D032FEF